MDSLILFIICLIMNAINAYLGYRMGKARYQPTYSKGVYQGRNWSSSDDYWDTKS